MEEIKEIILTKEHPLFRYDLVVPPEQWSKEFKNPIYVSKAYGAKNVIGAFFFFDSRNQAYNTGIKQQNCFHTSANGIMYITQCNLKADISVLDLTSIEHCANLIYLLKDQGFDIINSEFFRATDDEIKELNDAIEFVVKFRATSKGNCYDSVDFVLNVQKIEKFLGFDELAVGFLCQRITDCKNGVKFKCFLQEIGKDGYMFNETNNRLGSNTICILESDKFDKPVCTKEILIP